MYTILYYCASVFVELGSRFRIILLPFGGVSEYEDLWRNSKTLQVGLCTTLPWNGKLFGWKVVSAWVVIQKLLIDAVE